MRENYSARDWGECTSEKHLNVPRRYAVYVQFYFKQKEVLIHF